MDLKQIYEDLKAPFPPEAYSTDSSRGFNLTSLKAQYAIERLNDVLGINGWDLKGQFVPTEKGILYMGSLSILNEKEPIHSVEAIGYADNKKNIGDTYKSARTDALSKASSYFGLGNEMFKGNIQPGGGKAKTSTSFKKETKTADKPQKFRRQKKEETTNTEHEI